MFDKIITPLALISFASVLAASPANAGSNLQFSTGINYSTGKYGGTEATDVIVAPVSARLKTGAWTLRASIPYIRIEGPSNVNISLDESTGGGNQTTNGLTSTGDGTQSGFGDLALSATYNFDKIIGKKTYLDVTGRVRLPTGDEKKGLGSGATDYLLKAELGANFDKAGLYASAGRRILGDVTGVTREDGWQAEVGAWTIPTRNTVAGAYLDWRESISPTGEDPAEVGAYVSYRLNKSVRLSLNLSAGLSESSPDFGAGLSLSWRPDGRKS